MFLRLTFLLFFLETVPSQPLETEIGFLRQQVQGENLWDLTGQGKGWPNPATKWWFPCSWYTNPLTFIVLLHFTWPTFLHWNFVWASSNHSSPPKKESKYFGPAGQWPNTLESGNVLNLSWFWSLHSKCLAWLACQCSFIWKWRGNDSMRCINRKEDTEFQVPVLELGGCFNVLCLFLPQSISNTHVLFAEHSEQYTCSYRLIP